MINYGEKKVRELSGGMKRMLSMIITGMHSPSIVLLDEPTSGMDVVSRR
jgi:ABC-2 type transport system ATP-binding protein